jgi:aspartate aminotransferase
MPISQAAGRIQPSITVVLTSRAKEMRARGIDVVGLTAGEPDFDTPEHIKGAAVRAIRDGKTKYTPGAGIPELREAIAQKLLRDNGLEYSANEVLVGCGGKQPIFQMAFAVLNPGDEAIIPAPYWVSYPDQVKAVGGVPVVIEGVPENDLKITPDQLEAAITPHTRLFYLNSPSNPGGFVYTADELRALGEVVKGRGVWVLTDEIYEKIVYGGAEHHTIAALVPELKAQTVVVNGVSKAYAMTGWRVGYGAGPPEVIGAMGKLQSQETTHTSSVSQYAALAALTGPQTCVDEMVVAFAERRQHVLERLGAMPGVSGCPTPGGAFYVFPDVSTVYGRSAGSRTIDGSVALSEFLLEEMLVGVVPGGGFGMDRHVRLSYAAGLETLEQGLDRLEAGLGKLLD